MPVYNEAAFVGRSIEAILAQDYPSDSMEIIVVDAMSTDGTRAIVKSFQARRPGLRLVENRRRTVSTGLNLALRYAQGDVIVRVDGHCLIASDYISRCVQHLMEDDIDGVGGPIETIGETLKGKAIAAAMGSRFGVGGSAFRTAKELRFGVDTIAFPAYKKVAVERAGPFDEEMVRNQDDEFNYRLRKMGASLLLTPDLRSAYLSRSSFAALWRQFAGYGYWKVRVLQKHPRQMSPRQFVPPLFVVSLFVAAAMSPFTSIGEWALGIFSVSYVCANLIASLYRASSGADLVLLPVAFATIHISYGLGFIFGMFRFSGLWASRTKRQSPLVAEPVEQDGSHWTSSSKLPFD